MTQQVPFFRPDIGEAEIDEVVSVLRSGWLSTGPRVRRFEEQLGKAVGARHAIAVNSATAALHLAVEALGLRPGQGVLVPTMTFAATAEIVQYMGAIPVLVDCDPATLNIDLDDAGEKLERARRGSLIPSLDAVDVVGIIPVHVGGLMMDVDAVRAFATRHRLWIVEDAAHALPAAWRRSERDAWVMCGQGTADISCYSFYANKTITTAEGGMAVTNDDALAARMRLMSLHGLSKDAWSRYALGGTWDYRIVAAGFKYNLSDVAAAIGIHQLKRAHQMRARREEIAQSYLDALGILPELSLPPVIADRLHSWHLFPVRLNLECLSIDRDRFIDELRDAGIGNSVHWRPLHLHPYYEATFGWTPDQFPVATREWGRLVSLPLFPTMTADEFCHVITQIRRLCAQFASSTGPSLPGADLTLQACD